MAVFDKREYNIDRRYDKVTYKMKIEITEAQLQAIKNLADDMRAMIGCSDSDKEWKHNVKLIDKMLEKNKLKPRDFK